MTRRNPGDVHHPADAQGAKGQGIPQAGGPGNQSPRPVEPAAAEEPLRTPAPACEKLVGDLKGCYSRRINIQHRLVYMVDDRTIRSCESVEHVVAYMANKRYTALCLYLNIGKVIYDSDEKLNVLRQRILLFSDRFRQTSDPKNLKNNIISMLNTLRIIFKVRLKRAKTEIV
jgi:Txe/YoeB family toxin of toxin-antitoxin system